MVRIKKLVAVLLSFSLLSGMLPSGAAEDFLPESETELSVWYETEPDDGFVIPETEELLPSEEVFPEPFEDAEEDSGSQNYEADPDEDDTDVIRLGDEEDGISDEEDASGSIDLPDLTIEIPAADGLPDDDPAEADAESEEETEDGMMPGSEPEEEEIPAEETTEICIQLCEGTVLFRDHDPFAELASDGTVLLEPELMRITFTRDGENQETAYIGESAEYAVSDETELSVLELIVYERTEDEILTYEMAAYGLPGLGRELTAAEKKSKSAQAKHHTSKSAEGMIPGEDYVPGILLLTAQDEEYAREAAGSVGGTLLRYKDGLAVIGTDADAVKVMEAVCDPYAKIPSFSLNYRYRIGETAESGGKTWRVSEDLDLNAVPVRGTWNTMKGNDPFLQNPGADGHYWIDRDIASGTGGYQYVHSMVDTWSAWQFSTGKGVTVGIIDSGVYTAHEDFEGAVSGHPIAFMLDGENQTFTGTLDDYGHGSHVAGIIGARRNSKGGAGIAPDVTMISYRATDEYGYMDTEAIVAAVNAALQDGLWAVNCSFGGLSYNQAEADAFARLTASGTAVIAAAGNDSGMVFNYPAGYPDVISVSAVDPSGMRAPYSSYGTSTLSAPGSYILSTFNSAGSYRSWSGTSMATPVVTGTVALYYGYRHTRDLNGDGAVDAADVRVLKSKLTAACTKVTGSSTGMGAGIVNAGKLFSGMVGTAEVLIEPRNDDKTVPSDALIRLESGYEGAMMIYTLDGTTPAVKDTRITNGKQYTGPFEAGTGATKAGKRTLKVLTVSASGVRSKVLSYSFTLSSKVTESISFGTGSGTVVPGKSITLTATAFPLTTAKPVWKVLEGDAAITSGGVLKAAKTAAPGSTIRVSAAINGFEAESPDITVVPALTSFSLRDTDGRVLGKKETLLLRSGVNRMDFEIAAEGRKVSEKDFSISVSPAGKCMVSRVRDLRYRLIPSAPGKVTVKVKALDGSGLTRSFVVNIRQGVTSVTPQLPYNAVIGKSITLSASVYPSNASNKKLSWSVDETSAGLGIKVSKGKLVVPKTVPVGYRITVKAKSTDGTEVEGGSSLYTISDVPALYLTASDPKAVFSGEKAVSLKLFTHTVEGSDYDGEIPNDETFAELRTNRIGSANFAWSSSKPSVAAVSASGRVTAIAPGSATVTCKALDGSGAKASVKVQVVTPVTGMTLSPDTKDMSQLVSTLSLGASLTVKPYFAAEYGKASSQAVSYEKAVYRMPRGDYEVDEVTGSRLDIADAKRAVLITEGTDAIKLDSKGKLTAGTAFSEHMDPDGYLYFVLVTARASDGSGAVARHLVVLDKPDKIFRPSVVELYAFDEGTQEMIPQNVRYIVQQDIIRENTGSTYFDIGIQSEDRFANDFVVESSAPDVACIMSTLYRLHYNGRASYLKDGDEYYPAYRFFVYGAHPGEATVTIRFTDGTKQKVSFNVKVVPQ